MGSMKCRIMGVDPGQKGSVFYVERSDDGNIVDMRVIDCITHDIGKKQSINTQMMLEGTKKWPIANIAVMESQILKPGKGIETMLINFGLLQSVIERRANRIDFVTSREWKSYYKLSKNKKESVEKVRELYPEHTHLLMRPGGKEPSSDRAEALLMAHFGYETIWLPGEMGIRGGLF
jgi:hypothetical protein